MMALLVLSIIWIFVLYVIWRVLNLVFLHDRYVESSNPGVQGKVAGSFYDSSMGQEIIVLRKEGESAAHAMQRVKDAHN